MHEAISEPFFQEWSSGHPLALEKASESPRIKRH